MMPTVDISEVKRETMSASAITFMSSCAIWLISCASTPASSRAVSVAGQRIGDGDHRIVAPADRKGVHHLATE